jgi:hydrogenase expression/formation protein HypC
MCLAVPARVVAIEDDQASVELGGVRRKVALDLVPAVKVGDYVIVHVGFAIQRLDEVEARRTLSLLDELAAGEKRYEA